MIQGTLDRLHLGDLLQWFQMGGLSGRLTLIEGHQRRHLDFLDGKIVYASSTVPEERLASWLATEGLLPLTTLHRLLAVSLLRRTLFTNLLIERGGFSPEHLRNSVTRLAETITSRVLTAADVRFVLDPSYPVRQLLGLTLHVQPNSLVMEAARRNDECTPNAAEGRDLTLPTDDRGFESFFWQLIREGVSADERVDGEQVARLQQQVRDIVGTLSDWVTSGSGLVPVPAHQATRFAEWATHDRSVDLVGLPHATWNQMVLACAIRSPHIQHPETLIDLLEQSASLDLWPEMSDSSAWRRPTAGRIDEVTETASVEWSRTAEAAAAYLGVPPETVRLAVNLMVVPTDLVLWVLATLPIPHQRLRNTLLRELAPRLGLGLAQLSDFPDQFRRLFDLRSATPLGTCLELGRQAIPSARVWPATVPDSESTLQTVATPAALIRAAAAVRDASAVASDSSLAAG